MANAAGQGSLIGAALGVFKVDALIGRGAMGAVYLARDTRLNRRVALKVLLGSLARNKEVVRQFYREAKAAAPLNHPNIVRVYEAGVQANTPYIAMEFVDGEPLDRFLRRMGKLEWQQAFHIAGQVAQALECAHSHGVVHRDVKPANILLEKTGRVRLTDFGIANLQAEQGEGPPVIGTPQYMSPEQCKGNAVGPASDLFSLGVTIYQMIAGELPFKGDSSMAMVRSICTEDPKRLNKILPSVPDDVARVVAFLMEKQPEKRPANAQVVETLLARVQKEKGGRSALPDALTAFLKDQTEARPFAGTRSATPKPTRVPSKSGSAGKTTTRRNLPWAIVARVAVVAILAGLAAAAAPAINVLSRDTTAAAAPQLELSRFTNGSNGQVVNLLLNGYRVGGLNWTGDGDAVLVQASGLEGGLTHGASGLLAVVPEEYQALSVLPPAGPALMPDYGRARLAQMSGPAMSGVPQDSPMHDAVLVGVPGANNTVVLLAQRWDEAAPRPEVLYRQSLATGVAGLGDELRGAAIHPEGRRLALVVHDGLYNSDYVVERDVTLRDLTVASEPLTSTRGSIDGSSIQYSRDGRYLYYVRRMPASEAELCQTTSGGDATSERSVYQGVSGTFALQPQGERIALETAVKDQPPELVVIDTAGSVRARIGSGTLTEDAWAGDQLVVRAADPESGEPQLWLVDPLLAGSQAGWTRITQEPGGVDAAYAVSSDGLRVAVALRTADGPAVLLTPLPVSGASEPPRV